MKYSQEDTVCTHCGGEVNGHSCGDKVVRWCDVCGSNDKDAPPYIGIDLHKEKKKS